MTPISTSSSCPALPWIPPNHQPSPTQSRSSTLYSALAATTNTRPSVSWIISFYSPSSLGKLEALIQDNISRLISVSRRFGSTGEDLPLNLKFAALTSDIITECCLGGKQRIISKSKGFKAMVMETTDALTENMLITVQLQWLLQLMDSLPDWLIEAMLGPGPAKFNEFKRVRSFPPFKSCVCALAWNWWW